MHNKKKGRHPPIKKGDGGGGVGKVARGFVRYGVKAGEKRQFKRRRLSRRLSLAGKKGSRVQKKGYDQGREGGFSLRGYEIGKLGPTWKSAPWDPPLNNSGERGNSIMQKIGKRERGDWKSWGIRYEDGNAKDQRRNA